MGPNLPEFPQFFLTNDSVGILNSTFTLRRAANLNLSAINVSGGVVNFSYELVDDKLGFSMEPTYFNLKGEIATAANQMVRALDKADGRAEKLEYGRIALDHFRTHGIDQSLRV